MTSLKKTKFDPTDVCAGNDSDYYNYGRYTPSKKASAPAAKPSKAKKAPAAKKAAPKKAPAKKSNQKKLA